MMGTLILCNVAMVGLMIDRIVAARMLLAYAGSVIGLMTGLTVALVEVLIPYTEAVVLGMMSSWA